MNIFDINLGDRKIILANELYTERKESEELKSDSQVSSLDNWVESRTLWIFHLAIFLKII